MSVSNRANILSFLEDGKHEKYDSDVESPVSPRIQDTVGNQNQDDLEIECSRFLIFKNVD